MSEDHEKTQTLSIKTALASFTWTGRKTAELITVFALCLTGYVIWQDRNDDIEDREKYAAAMRLITNVIEDNAIAQREFGCLLSKDQGADRRTAFVSGECRAVARQGTSRALNDTGR